MINYTFIIPHKNIPSLLSRCLESIPQRNDIEVIIVDDNSDEKIVDFSMFPGVKRNDVTCIFLKESRGAGYARNKGIEIAKGKWLLFADADDFYTNDFPTILDKYKDFDEGIDLVYLASQFYYEGRNNTTPTVFCDYISNYQEGRIYAEKVLRYNMWTPWSRMVKRELVLTNNLKYEEIPVGNDKMFCLNCSKKATSITCEPTIVYNYFVPLRGSVTCSYSKDIENLKRKLDLIFKTNRFYDEVNYVLKPSVVYEFISDISNNLKRERWNIYCNVFKRVDFHFISDVKSMFMYLVAKIFKVL